MSSSGTDEARLRRWRMVLGSEADASCGHLIGPAAEMDQALAALYEADGPGGLQSKDRRGGRGLREVALEIGTSAATLSTTIRSTAFDLTSISAMRRPSSP